MVTFPPRDGTQSQSRNSQRILAVPWDHRIPKIRISTQQADTLQVLFSFPGLLIYSLSHRVYSFKNIEGCKWINWGNNNNNN